MGTDGNAPAPALSADERRSRLVGELRDLVGAEQSTYETLKAQADEAKHRRDGYQKALDLIVGVDKVQVAKSPAAAKRRGDGHDWTPSEEKIEGVLAAFRETYAKAGEPITRTMIENEYPYGGDTIRKAFEILRQREIIRVAGTTRGGGKLWALMPNASEGLSVAA